MNRSSYRTNRQPRGARNARVSILATLVCLVSHFAAGQPPGVRTCDAKLFALPTTASVTAAASVSSGTFVAPAAGGSSIGGLRPVPFTNLPEFCRVSVTLRPSLDSDIKAEVWMPTSGWNGKLLAVGNGGWGGVISYPALATALARGYAAASTDAGHATSGGAFVLGHPEKYADNAYRAVHETVVAASYCVRSHRS